MPRLLGVEIPADKRIEASLTYIYGVGPSTAKFRRHLFGGRRFGLGLRQSLAQIGGGCWLGRSLRLRRCGGFEEVPEIHGRSPDGFIQYLTDCLQ